MEVFPVKQLPPTSAKLRRRAVVLCIVTTAVVSATEITVGLAFNLISITGEGLHTAADLLDSIVAFILIAIAARPADPDHPYGHGKHDSLAATIEGLAVGITALWILYRAGGVLLGTLEPEPNPAVITVIAMCVASVVYFAVSQYVLLLADRTDSPAVYAEAIHLRTHVYITAALVVGLLLSRLALSQQWPYANRIDALVALGLGIFLVITSVRVVARGYHQLVDTALSQGELDVVYNTLDEFKDEFVEVHAIRSRKAGTERHVDIHLVVDAELTVREAHDLSHRIEAGVMHRLPETKLLVHIEPAVGDLLEAFLERGRVGAIFASEGSPAEREPGHHPRGHEHRG